jgi:MoaA/NifB/PqqE/SkfB family radical SAM enzyme
MTFELFKRIIDEYHKLGGTKIMLSPTIGEVLNDKGFFDKVNYAKQKGFTVQIFTNGILLYKNDNYKKIIDLGVDFITVSIGDVIPKNEAKIFQIPEKIALEKINGVLNLLKYKFIEKSKIEIILAFRAERSFKKIWGSIKKTSFNYFFDKRLYSIEFKTRYDNWCGNITKRNLLGIMKLKMRPLVRKLPCASLWRISILPNGDVRLCACRIKKTEKDELVIGNIYYNNLGDIVNNEKGQLLLDNWILHKYPEVCINCSRYYLPKKKLFS